MINRFLSWIKEAINKMLGQTTVKQALKIDIAISSQMAEALSKWSLMYSNQADWLSDDIKSLNLPSAIAGEIARSVTIEMEVTISGSPRADFLTLQFAKVLPKLRQMVEYGCAKGGLMMKPFVTKTGIDVDFVQADCFYPVAFDTSGNITACVFADQKQIGDSFYTRLESHQMTANGCEIINKAFKSTGRESLGNEVPLNSVGAWANLTPQATIKGISQPLYAYFRFPMANNIDPTSPLGVSCYSRATELIEQADKLWSNLIWEFESGKRAIYVDQLAFKKDETTGKTILPNKRLYVPMDVPGSNLGDGNKLFEAWTPEFREASIKSGLDAILKRIEYNCGLAYGSISDPQTVEKTATEIASTKQRSQATVTDTQKSLQSSLEQLISAMDIWATLYTLAPAGSFTTAYDFDDSIVVDHDAQIMQDRQTVTMGGMPIYIFLMRNYGLSEEDAKLWVSENQSEKPADTLFAPVK